MAAEIARAASTPSGAAAGAAAAREPPKPAGPGTVLVVPKKKQSSPPLRTPKKLAAAPAVRLQSGSSQLHLFKLCCGVGSASAHGASRKAQHECLRPVLRL